MARLSGSNSSASENEVNLILKATDQAAQVIDFTSDRVSNLEDVTTKATKRLTGLNQVFVDLGESALSGLKDIVSTVESIVNLVESPLGQTILEVLKVTAEEALSAQTQLSDTLFQLTEVGKPLIQGFANDLNLFSTQVKSVANSFDGLATSAVPTAGIVDDLFGSFLKDFGANSSRFTNALGGLFEAGGGAIGEILNDSFDIDLSQLEGAGIALDDFLANVFSNNSDGATEGFKQQLSDAFDVDLADVQTALAPIGDNLRLAIGTAFNNGADNPQVEAAFQAALANSIKRSTSGGFQFPGLDSIFENSNLDTSLRDSLEANFGKDLNSSISKRLQDEINLGLLEARNLVESQDVDAADFADTVRDQIERSLNLDQVIADSLGKSLEDSLRAGGIDANGLDLLKALGLNDSVVQDAGAKLKPLLEPVTESILAAVSAPLGETKVDNVDALARQIAEDLSGGLETSLGEINPALESTIKDIARTTAQNFTVSFRAEISATTGAILSGVEASLQRTLANIERVPQDIIEVSDAATQTLGVLNGIQEPVEIFTAIKDGASQAFSAIAQVSEQIFFFANGLQALQGLVNNGPFQLLVGQNVELREQLVATQSSLVATNDVIRNGQKITDNTEAIKALEGPVNQAIERLRFETLDLVGVTSQELLPIYQQVAQQIGAVGGGLDDAVDLSIKFAATLGTLNIPLFQSQEEIRSILQGTTDMNTQIAKSIGLSNQQLQLWISQGTIIDNLTKKLEAFSAGNALNARTLNGVTSNIQEVFEEVSRISGSVLITPLVTQVTEFYDTIRDQTPVFVSFVREILAQVQLIASGFLNATISVAGAVGPILENIPIFLFTSLAKVIVTVAESIQFVLVVATPFLEVLGAIAENVQILGGPLLKLFVLFKTVSVGVGLASRAFSSLANILPGVGEVLFLLRLRTTGIVGQFTNLANVTGASTSAFALLLKNLDKIPFAGKLIQDRFGPLAGLIQGFAPQVGTLAVTLGGLASASAPLRGALDGLVSQAPRALSRLAAFTRSTDRFGGILRPITPLIQNAARSVGSYSDQVRGGAAISELLNKQLTDLGGAFRNQIGTFLISGAALGGFFLLLNEVVLKNVVVQESFKAVFKTLSDFGKTIVAFFNNPLGAAILTLTAFALLLKLNVIPLLVQTTVGFAQAFAATTAQNIALVSQGIAQLNGFLGRLGDTSLKLLAERFPQILDFLAKITTAEGAAAQARATQGLISPDSIRSAQIRALSLQTLDIGAAFKIARIQSVAFFSALKTNAVVSIGLAAGLNQSLIVTGTTLQILRASAIAFFVRIGAAIKALALTSVFTAVQTFGRGIVATFKLIQAGAVGVFTGLKLLNLAVANTIASQAIAAKGFQATNLQLALMTTNAGSAAVGMQAFAGATTAGAAAVNAFSSAVVFFQTVILPIAAVLAVLTAAFAIIGSLIQGSKDLNDGAAALQTKITEVVTNIEANNEIALRVVADINEEELKKSVDNAIDRIREGAKEKIDKDRNIFDRIVDATRTRQEGVSIAPVIRAVNSIFGSDFNTQAKFGQSTVNTRLENQSEGFVKTVNDANNALITFKLNIDENKKLEENLIKLINQRTAIQNQPSPNPAVLKRLDKDIAVIEDAIEDNKQEVDNIILFLQTEGRADATSKAQRKTIDELIVRFKAFRNSLDTLNTTDIVPPALPKLGSTFSQIESNALAMEAAVKAAVGRLPDFEQRAGKLLELTEAQLKLGGVDLETVLSRINLVTSKTEASFALQLRAQQLLTSAIEQEFKRRTEVFTREQEIINTQASIGLIDEFAAEQELTKLKERELGLRRSQLRRNFQEESKNREKATLEALRNIELTRQAAVKSGDEKTAASASALAATTLTQFDKAELQSKKKLQQELRLIDAQIRKTRIDGEINALDKAQKRALDQVKIAENFRLIEIKKSQNALQISREEADAKTLQASIVTVDKEIAAAQIKLRRLRALFSNVEVAQVRAQQQTLQGLVLRRLQLEEDEYKRQTAVINREIQRRSQAIQNTLAREILVLRQESSALDILTKSLEQQNTLLNTRRELIDAQSGLFKSQTDGLVALERSEFKKQQIAQVAAANQLKVIQQQLALSDQLLEQELKKNRLALEREQIENRIAKASKSSDIARQEADLAKARRDRDTTPEEIAALEIALEQSRVELREIGNLSTLIDERFQNLGLEESNKRLIKQLQNGAENNRGLIQFFESLRPGQQTQSVRDAVRERLFENFQLQFRDTINAATASAAADTKIDVNGVPASKASPIQVNIDNTSSTKFAQEGLADVTNILRQLTGKGDNFPTNARDRAVFANDQGLEKLQNILSPEKFRAVFNDSRRRLERRSGRNAFGPGLTSIGRSRRSNEFAEQNERSLNTLAKQLGVNRSLSNVVNLPEKAIVIQTTGEPEKLQTALKNGLGSVIREAAQIITEATPQPAT